KADSLELPVPRTHRAPAPADHAGTSGDGPVGAPLGQTIEELERQRILEALHETRWNISSAARRLGVTRNVLRYRVQKYELRLPRANEEPTEPSDSVRNAVKPMMGYGPPKAQWERRHVAVLRADLDQSVSVEVSSTGVAGLESLVEKVESFGGRGAGGLGGGGGGGGPGGSGAGLGRGRMGEGPRRGAHAALAIQKVAARTDGSLPRSSGARVGLHIGEFLVARVGDVPRVDHSAKRGAWQQLEALMGEAEPGTVLVSGATRAFLERRFVLAPFTVNHEGSESVYRLEGLERTGLGLGEQLMPFVARDREREHLAQALDHARTRHGQVIGVVGEPGVGKSRLLWEFINSRCVQDSLVLV